jgi:F-type H+-transporting ATPase subunit epsilon
MTLQVELVSPERILYSGEAEMVIARTVGGGEIAFMTGHAPFVGALDIALVTIRSEGGDEVVAVHGGFVEVSANPEASRSDGGSSDAAPATRVTILSDVAELGRQVDVGRAEQARDQAEATLRESSDDEGAHLASRRATVRLAAANAPG